MKKVALYLPLLANDLKSNKSSDILMNYGYSGYGIYIALQQKLITTPERKFELSQVKQLAFDLHLTVNELQPIISNYFDTDDTFFYSIELNERMQYFDDKYNKASEGGKKAASNLTPEQRKERADKAIQTRWNNEKSETPVNTDDILTSKYDILSGKNEILTPLVSDTNNRIEKNRIEEKRKEKNEPSVLEKNLNLENDDESIVGESKVNEKVTKGNTIPSMSDDEISKVLNKFNFSSYLNEVITRKYIEFVDNYTSIEYDNYFDYFVAITSSLLIEHTPIKYLNKEKITHQISLNEIDVNSTIHQLSDDTNELNNLKKLANHISMVINQFN